MLRSIQPWRALDDVRAVCSCLPYLTKRRHDLLFISPRCSGIRTTCRRSRRHFFAAAQIMLTRGSMHSTTRGLVRMLLRVESEGRAFFYTMRREGHPTQEELTMGS